LSHDTSILCTASPSVKPRLWRFEPRIHASH
jgi:hypothetical protein